MDNEIVIHVVGVIVELLMLLLAHVITFHHRKLFRCKQQRGTDSTSALQCTEVPDAELEIKIKNEMYDEKIRERNESSN